MPAVLPVLVAPPVSPVKSMSVEPPQAAMAVIAIRLHALNERTKWFRWTELMTVLR
jgi:hypothetical protein